MITVRCKVCNVELTSNTKIQCCGCENMMKIVDNSIGAMNLDLVEIVNNSYQFQKKSILSKEDLKFQESRKQRKVRKIEFEER